MYLLFTNRGFENLCSALDGGKYIRCSHAEPPVDGVQAEFDRATLHDWKLEDHAGADSDVWKLEDCGLDRSMALSHQVW